MSSVLIDLCPNRQLLDSNFDGYKLSLQEIQHKKLELSKQVDPILLNSSQYTLLHAKLYGLHNHLIGDPFDETGSVYFVDIDWNICKTYLDPFTEDLIQPIVVWQIPRESDRKVGDYNVSLKFVNKNIVVVADGTGFMHIVKTDSRNDDNIFTLLFSDKVSGNDEGFVILDAVLKSTDSKKEELHVLLMNIKQDNPEERFATILYWISFSKSEESWQQNAIRQLKTVGDIQYAALERDCISVYVVSDSGCKFILNSDCPVVTESKDANESVTKTYQWKQDIEEVTIKFQLENIDKQLVHVDTKPTEIEVKYNGNNLLSGQLYQRINPEATTWIINQEYLEVTINKSEAGLIWPEVVIGNQEGKYILDTCIVEEVHAKLAHLCNDSETSPQSGTTFNSQQVEECDFESDKTVAFERLNGNTNCVTHKINLGSHQVLLTVNLNAELSPAIGIRHDVDVCLWQPQGSGDDFSVTHEGTLLAFGYVQASKQNRKFTVCPPNMGYSAICESSTHLFVYRQKHPVSSGELRNRTTGRRIQNTAQQQVVKLSCDEIIGIYATNTTLFLLSETSVIALRM